MATRTIANGGGNFSANGTWVEGVAPTSADDVVATGTSGQLTVDTTTCVCKSLVLTGYTNTMTFTSGQKLTVSGNVTWASGMTISGTGTLAINATCTYTSNTKTFTGALTFSVAATTTFGDNAVNTGDVTVNTGAQVWNGNQITCNGSLTATTAISGTTLIIMGGTGTISTANNGISISNSVTINTSGTTTIGASGWAQASGTITYISGTIAGTGTLTVNGNITLNTNGMTWPTIYIRVASTITTSSALQMTSFTQNNSASWTFSGANNITIANCTFVGIAASSVVGTFPSGIDLNVTNTLTGCQPRVGPTGLDTATLTVKSSTGSSSFNLKYTGSISNCCLVNMVFTDVDASGSQQPILNFNGGTLTRCKNIYNKTLGNQLTGPAKVGMVYTSQGQPENVTWS